MSKPKNNFFDLLQLPPNLKIDYGKLKKNYFNLLKDNSADGTKDKDQQKKTRELIKTAYETLKDRATRIEHLLDIWGLEVANDNKPPLSVAPLARLVQTLLARQDKSKTAIDALKKVHKDVISEFSTISIELDRLESAWDNSDQQDKDILKRLKRKMAAFCYIKDIEQNIRTVIQ